MKIALFILLLVAVWQGSAYSQSASDQAALDDFDAGHRVAAHPDPAIVHAKWNVCVDLQMVAVEESKALELITDFRSDDEGKEAAAWAKLHAMLKSGEANLLAWPTVRMADGSRAVAETLIEQRYPSEFEPPQQPQTLSAVPEIKRPRGHRPPVHEDLPNSYETRDLGMTLEVEPTVVKQGARVFLDLHSQRLDWVDKEIWDNVLTIHAALVSVIKPLFSRNESRLSLNLQSGRRQLIAVHKLAKPVNYVELDLVRVVVTKAE